MPPCDCSHEIQKCGGSKICLTDVYDDWTIESLAELLKLGAMTLLIVQLIMGGLGLTTGLLIALFGPGKRWIRWPLAFAAGVGVAITAWPGLWTIEISPNRQLFQSLLLASVVVLIALFTMILLYPRRRQTAAVADASDASNAAHNTGQVRSAEAVMDELSVPQEAGRDAISLDLEQSPDAIIATQQEHSHMHLLGSAKKSIDSLSIDPSVSANVAFSAETQRDESSSIDSDNPTEPDTNNDLKISSPTADVVSLAERRELREGEAAADALDLSDSEDLYMAMRDAEAELELPVDSSWLDDEPDTHLEVREDLTDAMDDYASHTQEGDIEDAEILSIDEDMLLTDELIEDKLDEEVAVDNVIKDDSSHEDVSQENASNDDAQESDSEQPDEAAFDETSATDDEAPATLGAALQAQRRSLEQLSNDTDTLAARLSEWRKLSDSNEQQAWASSLQQLDTVDRQQNRIEAENNFRAAAVELIHTQRDVIKQLMKQISALGDQRKEDLATLTALQQNAVNQRRLAREAALLARKAAADKQSANGHLDEERRKHERTQAAAKRAMVIARDAIDKLAEHERRLGISNNPKKPDSRG